MDIIDKIAKDNNMEWREYAYFNDDNFSLKNNKPCYIPENADDETDVFSYLDLLKACEDYRLYLIEIGALVENTAEIMVRNLYEDITWEFPSTFLESCYYNE